MSAMTEVKICNLALYKIGQARINSLSDRTKAAMILNEIFEPMRDEVLCDHPWNFALKRDSFSLLAAVPAYEYSYQFQKPVDCLRIWRPESENIIFVVEDDKILTNEATFKCQYIMKVTNPAKFSSGYVQALAFRLASELAYPLVNSTQLQISMFEGYKQRLAISRSIDSQEGTPSDVVIQTNFLESRY